MAKVGKAAQAKRAPKVPAKQGAAKKAVAVLAPTREQNSHISIRRISNGWLVRESREVNGKYEETETYTKAKPTVNIPK